MRMKEGVMSAKNIYGTLNRWQEDRLRRDGGFPKCKEGKRRFALLGQAGNTVTVVFKSGAETYTVTDGDESDISNGLINTEVLGANLSLWLTRGLSVSSDGRTITDTH